jgi:hypothetical protein
MTFSVRSVDVTCTLNSDHESGHSALRLWANNGLMHRSIYRLIRG